MCSCLVLGELEVGTGGADFLQSSLVCAGTGPSLSACIPEYKLVLKKKKKKYCRAVVPSENSS